MAPLGPFGRRRRVAVAVSGGADSMALALLARGWGELTALVVDHGLRPGSAQEAATAVARVRARGIPAHLITLTDLHAGPGLQARARSARHRALAQAATGLGLVDILFGHHAGDQRETIAMRADSGSGATGLAGMSALATTGAVRLLRPLLGIEPGRLRDTLLEAGVPWTEDPSNDDVRHTRTRWRRTGAPDDTGADGVRRAEGESRGWPASVAIHPAGFAAITGTWEEHAVAAAVWTVSGRPFPPSPQALRAAVARDGGTLHGTRLVPAAARLLVIREEAAAAPARPAHGGVSWDGRFVVDAPPGTTVGQLGDEAAGLRRWSRWPACVLRTVPAFWRGGALWAVPHLRYPSPMVCASVRIAFRPARPLMGSPFVPWLHGTGVNMAGLLPMFVPDGGRSGPGGGFIPRPVAKGL